MPTYDFRCNGCQIKFTQRVSFEKKDQVHCPECGSRDTKQIFTGLNIGKGSQAGASSGSACGTCSGGSCC
ncbi:FmdB family zinc ribbon protein [Natranaerobius thermophilus]|uniref:Regulatory protein, FmdB family n=1 Tax=Natranaerobius thermophilus (strain ATCC BAA-1301 / DSM 18059 / JW/NM-WN-LF) TaxID=457570 RepID=B2A6V1_NATTJ|nr:zinc ribbon domain-containing protein [Natranaerobius thermophilus]ACB84232.1 regulatory protein, FmdB family [Natranaerobius thermophilus JW/NM-WN-LF]